MDNSDCERSQTVMLPIFPHQINTILYIIIEYNELDIEVCV